MSEALRVHILNGDAHFAGQPRDDSPGRPKDILTDLLAAHSTFGAVFLAFCKQAPEYGFGDLQVKRHCDELQNEHPNNE